MQEVRNAVSLLRPHFIIPRGGLQGRIFVLHLPGLHCGFRGLHFDAWYFYPLESLQGALVAAGKTLTSHFKQLIQPLRQGFILWPILANFCHLVTPKKGILVKKNLPNSPYLEERRVEFVIFRPQFLVFYRYRTKISTFLLDHQLIYLSLLVDDSRSTYLTKLQKEKPCFHARAKVIHLGCLLDKPLQGLVVQDKTVRFWSHVLGISTPMDHTHLKHEVKLIKSKHIQIMRRQE